MFSKTSLDSHKDAGWLLRVLLRDKAGTVKDVPSSCVDRSVPCRFRPRHLVGGLFSWISQVSSVPDEQVARVAGFDGLAYIKFLNLCMRIAAGVMYAQSS